MLRQPDHDLTNLTEGVGIKCAFVEIECMEECSFTQGIGKVVEQRCGRKIRLSS